MNIVSASNISKDNLKSFIERIERLEEEKSSISSDIREIYQEAKANGFDPKIIREVIKIRQLAEDERSERESLIDTYLHALGMNLESHE